MKVLILFIILNTFLQSQTEHSFKLGTGFSYNYHSSNISSFSNNYSCCGEFRSINEFNNVFSFSYGFSILNRLDLYSSVNYSKFNGRYSNSYFELINVDGINENGEIQYALDYKFDQVNLVFGFEYEMLKNFYLNLGVGSAFINNYNLNGYEEIINPKDRGTFKINDSTFARRRNEFDFVPEINSLINLNIALSYALPLSKNYSSELRPKISFSVIPEDLLEEDTWNIYQLSFGVDLVYYLNRKDPNKYFEKEILIDEDLFVTAFLLSKRQERMISELEFTKEIYNTKYISKDIDSVKNEVEYNSNFPGLRFRYDYSLVKNPISEELYIDYQGREFIVDLKENPSKYNFSFNTDEIIDFDNKISFFIQVENSNNIYRSKRITKQIDMIEKNYNKFVIEIANNSIDLSLIDIDNFDNLTLIYASDKILNEFLNQTGYDKSKINIQKDYELDNETIIIIEEL